MNPCWCSCFPSCPSFTWKFFLGLTNHFPKDYRLASLYFHKPSFLPFLKIGLTFVSLQSSGTSFSPHDHSATLRRPHKGIIQPPPRTSGCMISRLTDLCLSDFLKIFLTWCLLLRASFSCLAPDTSPRTITFSKAAYYYFPGMLFGCNSTFWNFMIFSWN